MKKFLLLFICSFFLIQCYTISKGVRKNFTYCFNGEKTGLDSLININGFYYLGEDYDSLSNGEYIFYDNGLVQSGAGRRFAEQNFDNSIKYGSYGSYLVSSDTIKMQIITSPAGMGVIEYKVWFKIIDFNSIEIVYKGRLNNITKRDIEDFKKKIKSDDFYKRKGSVYKFRYIKSKPDFNKKYIMRKKWFWCDEKKYEEWKEKNSK